MKTKILLTLAMAATTFLSLAKPVELDKIAVIVNQGVVLESQIQALVDDVKRNAEQQNQQLPSDTVLRTQAIERLILNSLQMQMAERMGIQVSDPQLDQTISGLAQEQGISLEQLVEALASQGISYDEYREEIRTQMITGEVRRANVRRRIYITPQEVEGLVKLISEQGDSQVEYHLGHILIGLPSQPSTEEIEAERERAGKVIELLNNGSDFAKIAVASSAGSKALDGGDMGWMNINEMPTLFAEAVQGKKAGDLIGPIRSGAGFHILKILDLRGQQTVDVEQVNARHILIKPSVILSDKKAQDMLLDFRAKLIAGEADFATLAKEHSEDTGSALKGGDLGWTEPKVFVPEFSKALATLDKGEYSQPVRSQFGWHLIQLLDRRMQDGSEKLKQDQAYEMLFKRKFAEESDAWLREMRDEAYVEIVSE
ncbi:peptidylprolyl isomerase SurA [Bowmanella sp. JS7-9]|uniref:Chaperone SurA n=1 Tax=Pseudobowmanella zhangzhouensis TaxID=1537679 RepID=A0ABW1XLJ6_9ALTE|nr:peptidylprolyl isomerase SurA [Bowmanella sp. JS7-9]TBX22012.1 peptidylprolyl isomerase [Bowmanella sp. JS7-9]